MRISVIIPVYNAEATIIRALNSVVHQTTKPFEIILIDDGSKDNSHALISSYSLQHASFKFKLIRKDNGGVSSARNLGLKAATGEYIALLDSDDEWLLDKLQKQLEVFKNNNDVSFVGGLIYKPKSVKEGRLSEISLTKLVFKNYFQPSTVMFKKDIVSKIGFFDESQRYAEEGNYFMRIANRYKCYLMNEQVVIYDQGKEGYGQSGLSANLKEMEIGELKNLKFAYKQKYISVYIYSIAVVLSIIKYIRRVLIVKFL